MNLFIKQRVFSWAQRFDICDINGTPIYSCVGEIFSFGNKLRIFDQNGVEVVFIKQILFKFLPRYEIYIHGQLAATIVKEFTLFKHSFYFEGLNWLIQGDFLAHNYHISSGADTVVSISKRWISWGDTYDININEKYNPLLALASCIVIDTVCHHN